MYERGNQVYVERDSGYADTGILEKALVEDVEIMAEKCDLCSREVGRYVDKIERIQVGQNEFEVCDICKRYLESGDDG